MLEKFILDIKFNDIVQSVFGNEVFIMLVNVVLVIVQIQVVFDQVLIVQFSWYEDLEFVFNLDQVFLCLQLVREIFYFMGLVSFDGELENFLFGFNEDLDSFDQDIFFFVILFFSFMDVDYIFCFWG